MTELLLIVAGPWVLLMLVWCAMSIAALRKGAQDAEPAEHAAVAGGAPARQLLEPVSLERE